MAYHILLGLVTNVWQTPPYNWLTFDKQAKFDVTSLSSAADIAGVPRTYNVAFPTGTQPFPGPRPLDLPAEAVDAVATGRVDGLAGAEEGEQLARVQVVVVVEGITWSSVVFEHICVHKMPLLYWKFI